MRLFTPKMSEYQKQLVQARIKQIQETVDLVNTTTNPEVFFGRLNFLLDVFLDLQKYEKYKCFKGTTPTQNYNNVISNIEAAVDEFIERALSVNKKKLDGYKTEKTKSKNYAIFATTLMEAFDLAHTFWVGILEQPHYTGPLFTDANYKRVQEIYKAPNPYGELGGATNKSSTHQISDEEVPALIQLGYGRAIERAKQSENPKFHRSWHESDLAFNFSETYGQALAKLENDIYGSAKQIGPISKKFLKLSTSEEIQAAINRCQVEIDAFEQCKAFCYSKGAGGVIWFQDRWEYCHNSRNECFSYIDSTLTLVTTLQQVLKDK